MIVDWNHLEELLLEALSPTLDTFPAFLSEFLEVIAIHDRTRRVEICSQVIHVANNYVCSDQ